MFEKFAEDVSTRYQEKLADILSNRMDIEDWLTGTLEERNRYADSLGEGNYQLFNLGGKPYSIYDFGLFIDKNKAPKFRNLAFDSDNKLKIMDYLVNVFEKGRKR